MQRIVIFGATSAIATACARRWVVKGNHLFLVGRDQNKLETVLTDLRVRGAPGQRIEGVDADLNDHARHPDLLAKAEAALGGIDVVLIAHGTLPDQKACEQSVSMTLQAIDTNALSAISLLTLTANRLESQRFGTIAVIGSVAGDRGRQSNYIYGASKGMLAIFMQGLRNRLARKGVAVLLIKPGFVDTPMTAHIKKKGALWAQPDSIAEGILEAVAQRRDTVYLPSFWRWIMLVIRMIPETFFKRLSL